MLSDSARFALFDIRDNILFAREFIEGLTYEAFKDSRLHFYAVTRALEIVSEATRRLPDDLRGRHSSLPWRDIRDAGNLYRHSYDNVAESYVWETVKNHLAPLLAVAVAEIDALDKG
ncbi:MAG: HepT-like ribonuclease domain-containing protein [Beijerinckiaceae bacterium]|jgi:uncharacterized protein with HEPN domain